MAISAPQMRAARGLLNWSVEDLASRSRVEITQISAFEATGDYPGTEIMASLRSTLESAGVAFIDSDQLGSGVRFLQPAGVADVGLRPDQLNSSNDG
ncbi:hypothetical protein HDIA_1486 [Hartmannibacter diazotrophicus]|uniref:HTH cro/C1-type domain-containing protein n=2 Tax=Hartmannibacter diazotrophicus TaxID=1482074 RepID=A0A2C9D3X6_9HYPH|nr:hypothetical protein HDIA_1486 [Hartmannibacter diazotrophicus]